MRNQTTYRYKTLSGRDLMYKIFGVSGSLVSATANSYLTITYDGATTSAYFDITDAVPVSQAGASYINGLELLAACASTGFETGVALYKLTASDSGLPAISSAQTLDDDDFTSYTTLTRFTSELVTPFTLGVGDQLVLKVTSSAVAQTSIESIVLYYDEIIEA